MRTAGRWPPLMLTRPTPGSCEIFCASRVSARSSTCGQRQGLRGERQRQDRRVGRIDLGVDRRRRQVGRQQVAGGVDRRLHLLLGDVEAEVEAELQGDDRGAGRAGRGHLVEARHLAELPLQRRGDRGGHHLRAGAGIEGLHLDGRVVDLAAAPRAAGTGRRRMPTSRIATISSDGRHRPQDEEARRVHGAARRVTDRCWPRCRAAAPARLARGAAPPPAAAAGVAVALSARRPEFRWSAAIACGGRHASPWRRRAAGRRRRSPPGRPADRPDSTATQLAVRPARA